MFRRHDITGWHVWQLKLRSDVSTASSKGHFLVEVQVKSFEKGGRKREIKGEENDG